MIDAADAVPPRAARRRVPTAPAAADGRPSRAKSLLVYLAAAVLAATLMARVLRLNRCDPRAGLFLEGGDVSLHIGQIKTIAETGWYYRNDRLGAPGALDARDLPSSDGWLHLALAGLIGRAFGDPFRAAHYFYLATFPLTAVTALFVGRRLGFSFAVAFVIGLLYAFLPYHFQRLDHLFLASYYLAPLSLLPALSICQGLLPLRRAVPGGGDRWSLVDPAAAGVLLIALLTGWGGIYYAIFACVFLFAAGSARAYAERRLAPLLSAGVVIGATGLAQFISLTPTVYYKLTEPRNAEVIARYSLDAETYGLKIAQLLLPVSEHRWGPFRRLKEFYNQCGTPLINENDSASLGIVGAVGFLSLLLRWFLRRGRGRQGLADGLAVLTLAAVLLSTVGGLGSVIAFLISPMLRGYNRISVFIAFFALLEVGLLLQRLAARWSGAPWGRMAFRATLAGVLGVGLLDQVPRMDLPHEKTAARTGALHRFVERVETDAPRGASVFQLPYDWYPEGAHFYHLLLPSLHSHHLRWSFGAIRGHFGDEWSRRVARLSVDAMVVRLAEAGFVGVCVNRNCFDDRGACIETDLRSLLAVAPIVSEVGDHSYFDLGPFTARVRARIPPTEWERRCEAARHAIVPLKRNGFYAEGNDPGRGPANWCGRSGELHLRNDLARTRVVRLRMELDLPLHQTPEAVKIVGPGWDDTVRVGVGEVRTVERRLALSPGNHVIRLTCAARPWGTPKDPSGRRLVFRLSGLECDEDLGDASEPSAALPGPPQRSVSKESAPIGDG